MLFYLAVAGVAAHHITDNHGSTEPLQQTDYSYTRNHHCQRNNLI